MSEPVDSSADSRPSRAEPRDGAMENSTTPTGQADHSAAAPQGRGPRRNSRRRGSRGGRGRKRTGAQEAAKASGGASAKATVSADDADPTPDLPDRPGENRASPDAAARALIPKPKIGDSRPDPADEDNEAPEPATGARRRRRRGGRGRGGGGGGGNGGRAATATVEAEAQALDEETLDRRRGRERKGRPVGRYLMTVHVRPEATQIAVLEGRALIEHYVSRPQDDATQIHGNIYLGRVQNVLPGMEAAFVDIGTPKNAVLYRGDVQYDPEDVVESGAPRIEQMLRARQTILCQVTKNPIGTKGARLTQEVSLPGRFVVLIPNSTTYGISKRLAEDEALPLFERYHVHEQLHKALDRKVWLPSGGSLIIERTEALTVIDVNTGKNVGSSSLEETVFRNNLEAAEEIARQLRLRDIGGIIVIDFIDMEVKKNRDEVLRVFKASLARDKTRTQVFEISELGLVEMTRKRVSEGLVESFSMECPTCAGRGIVLDESLL